MFKFKLYLNLTNFQKRDVWYSVRFHFMCSLALTFESDWRTGIKKLPTTLQQIDRCSY